METAEYVFVGGPLDGQVHEFTGTASWWGFGYNKDGVVGEYNTSPMRRDGTSTYAAKPYRLYWRSPDDPSQNAEWELAEVSDDMDPETLEEYIEALIRNQNG